jgi:predicted secreted protein
MNRPVRQTLNGLVAACGMAAAGAWAQTLPPPPPQNVVSLSASASMEVTKDWLTVVFSTTREGADPAVVQSQLRQALDVALAEARKAARPGQLEVLTGAFSLYPRYAPVNPKQPPGQPGIAGWLGSTELVVEGRDTQAIAQLTGRIQTMSIARVAFSLSREAREKVDGDVSAQAISRFRARADAVSRQFGFSGYTVREVNVSSNEPPGQMQPVMRAQAASRAMADESLPVEAGKAVVTATVSGSVQMNK